MRSNSQSPPPRYFAKIDDAVSDTLDRHACPASVRSVMTLIIRAKNGISRGTLIQKSVHSRSAVDDARRSLRALGLIKETRVAGAIMIHATPAEELPPAVLLKRQAPRRDTRATVPDGRHFALPKNREFDSHDFGSRPNAPSISKAPRRGAKKRSPERDPLPKLPSIAHLLVTDPNASAVGKEAVWLRFANPPADEIRDALKAIGFRYTPEDRTWSCERSLRVDRAMEAAIPTLMEAARNRAFERIRCEIQGGHPDNARHFDEWPEFLRRCRNEGQDAAEAWLRDVLGSPRAGAEKSTCDDS